MARLMKDELFEAQLLRAVGYAPYGGPMPGNAWPRPGRFPGPTSRPGTTPGPWRQRG
jgi:hypothetical protein